MRQLKISKSITNRDSQSLEKYLQEINKLKMITADEELALCLRVKEGDKTATDQLVKANLRFVVSVAKQYQHRGISLSDLVNEGNIGLISAVERFDSSRGFKFISYAVWWIRQSILVSLASHARMVRLPSNRVSVNNRIQKVMSAMEQDLERSPSEEELADAMNMNISDITYYMSDSNRCISLDAPLSDGESGTMMDNLVATDSVTTDTKLYHTESLKMEMLRSMQRLTLRQREILCFIFGIGGYETLSIEEVGKKYDVSNERIRQIKDKAIKALKAKDNRGTLRSFL